MTDSSPINFDRPPRARVGPGRGGVAIRIVALLAALALAFYGITSYREAQTNKRDAQHSLRRARRALARIHAQARGARADLAAAQAAITDFTSAARGATDVSAQLIDAEAALTDRLARLRAAGASGEFGTYNRLVDELNGSVDALKTAAANLETPFESLSKSLTGLPTAPCAGKLAADPDFVDYGSSGLKCARVKVPLDYARPHGPSIEITAVKRPADDPGQSLGPLFLNPGGPGGSAIAFLREASLLLPPAILRQFDLIGVDPRGVGQSSPVDCADSLDPLFDNQLTNGAASVRAAALHRIQQLVARCATRSDGVLPYVDTVSAARDIDRVREVLQVNQISYIGFSYGTYLGTVYADLFPDRLRAAVLDSAVTPRRAQRTVSLKASGSDFTGDLTLALANCSVTPTCSFFNNGNPSQAYDDLMTKLTITPLNVAGRKLGRGLAELGVLSVFYEGDRGWPRLMDALTHAELGDGAPLLALSDGYSGRRKDGSYNNELEAHYAISCIELGRRPSPADARNRLRHLGHLGRFDAVELMLTLPCAFWPAPPAAARQHLDGKGAAPIVVVGNAGDPVTPIEDAEALSDALDSAVLLRWEGDGHTAVGRGVDCIDNAITDYLVDLSVPADGTSCPA